MNEHIATEIEATTKIQTKELLMNTKSELEQAAVTIKELNHELEI